MTVWVVTESGFDYGVVTGIYATRELAEVGAKTVDRLPGGDVAIEEWDVYEMPPAPI